MKKEMSMLFIMMIISFLAVFVILYKGIKIEQTRRNNLKIENIGGWFYGL